MNGKKCLGILSILGLFIGLFYHHPSLADMGRYDVLIKNAKIVDGTGKPAFNGDIAIKDEKIIAVGKVEGEAKTVIDASALIASPGFIDPHSHADMTILKYPHAESYIMQGITTFLAGNCGMSAAPAKNLTFGEWLADIEKHGMSINMAMLVGHGRVRGLVMGEDFRREATSAEIEKMKDCIEEAMRSGAFGFSVGFDYLPGEFADNEEIIELAKVVQEHGGLYQPHTRYLTSKWATDDPMEVSWSLFLGKPEDAFIGRYAGYQDAIEVSRRTDIRLNIAHMVSAYPIPQPHLHSDFLEYEAGKATVLEIIDKSREEGLKVSFNMMPRSGYIIGKQRMIDAFYSERVIGLKWVRDISKEDFVKRLKTKEFRERLRKVHDDGKLKFVGVHTKAWPYWMDCFRILEYKNRDYEGKTLGEIARLRKTNALELMFDMITEDPDVSWAQVVEPRAQPAYLKAVVQSPYFIPSTDSMVAPAKLNKGDVANPNAYGLYPHYIRTYVKDEAVTSLVEAIRKATSLPAQVIGLKDRGVIEEGAFADIVLFDFNEIRDMNDFLNPDKPPQGIEYVLVNGTVVYENMTHSGKKPGKVLRHKI